MTEPSTPDRPAWQRAPFEPGHELSMTHGAKSPRRVEPVAADALARLLADPATPAYLRDDASFGGALRDLARTEAIVDLMWTWLAAQDVDQPSKRVFGVLDQLHRFLRLLGNQRSRLGLDPAGRARLSRDFAGSGRLDLAKIWELEGDADSPEGTVGDGTEA